MTKGAETWFVDKDGRNLGLRLFNVDWPINNYDGYFTRDSLVIYVIEKLDDGSTKEHGYAFTLPGGESHRYQPQMATGQLLHDLGQGRYPHYVGVL